MPQIFDPTTVTPEQMSGLNNVPGQSLTTTNSDTAIQTAQNLNPSPNIPAYKTGPTPPVVLGSQSPTVDYKAIMAGLQTAQTAVDTTQGKITADSTALGNQSADQANFENQDLTGAGSVVADQKGLSDLNAQMTALNNEANAQKIKIGDQPIEMNSITGQQNQVEHERTIKALGISSQIQAMQGNLKLASDQVTKALSLKYDPIKAEITTLNNQLNYNYKNLTSAQQQQANAIKDQNDIKLRQVNNQIATEKEFATTLNQGLANGMPANVATQAQQLFDAGNETGARVLMSKFTGSPGQQTIIDKYSKSLGAWNKKGTREQFIRELQAQHPNINPDDIAASVYKTYPDGYEQ